MPTSAAIETAPREELEALQLERLQATLARIREHRGPVPEIAALDELQNLPFTVKDDLRNAYPLGLLTVPLSEIRRIHASSGTGGKPTVVGYTEHDLGVWSEVMARSLTMAGVRSDMVVHNAYGYGLFTGGLGFHHGAELCERRAIHQLVFGKFAGFVEGWNNFREEDHARSQLQAEPC